MNDIIICSSESGDWSGLYINRELYAEGHDIYTMDWIRLIKDYNTFSGKIDSYEVSDAYCEKYGSFPFSFDNIPKECLISE